MQLWERSDNYFGEDYSDYYVLISRNRDSSALDNSNFDAALKRLGGQSDTIIVATISHWLCGWVDMLLIHKDDTVAVAIAEKIERDLEEYPILDDDLFDQWRKDLGNDEDEW